MRIHSLLFLVLMTLTPQSFAQPSLEGIPLTYLGLGPIHLGMSQSQLKKLGFKLSENPSGYDKCVEVTLVSNEKIIVMLENDKVTRISSYDSSLKTQSGVKVGATETQVKKAYGLHLQVNPHKYDENGHYLVVKSHTGKYAIVFETNGVKVTAIHAGLESSAQYVEGCL